MAPMSAERIAKPFLSEMIDVHEARNFIPVMQ